MIGLVSTIGYEKTGWAEFLARLRSAGIRQVIDVRDLPLSRRAGFSKRALAAGLAARFMAATAFRSGRSARLIPTRANGQPAFGVYVRDPHAGVAHANGILVLTLSGSQISVLTGFDNSALHLFGLPRTLPEPDPGG